MWDNKKRRKPMPKYKIHELDDAERKKIVSFLTAYPVGVLALVDTEGNPHASTIYFSVDDALTITFTTKQDTFKYENLLKHDAVMLVVFDASKQMAVQISGHAVEVTDPETAHTIYLGTLHAAKETGEDAVPPVAKIAAGSYVAFAIHPNYVQLSEYGWGDNFANTLKHANDPNRTGDPA
jgi:general stress protein 26